MSTENNNVYQFIVSWILMIVLLTLINKTKLGHVLIYYGLLLMILLILATEYQQIAPMLAGIQSVGQFNAKQTSSSSSSSSQTTAQTAQTGGI